jgi:membrane protease YdiL (CAAX protease family)
MKTIARLWQRIPVVIRAVILGELVVTIGGAPPELALIANLRLRPDVPWMLLPAAVWLWLFWRFLNGDGPPRLGAAGRRELLRAQPLGGAMWRAALLFGTFALAACLCLAFLTVTLVRTPMSAFRIGIDFAPLPWWTIVSCLIVISVTAGVIEEAGFRGYMLTPIQQRHGWTVATLITGFMFFLDHHLSHAYATWAFLPFFMTISAAHAMLVRRTGSIKPSAVLHSIFDLAVIPVMYGLVARLPVSADDAIRARMLVIESLVLAVLAAGSWWSYRRLVVSGEPPLRLS